MLSLDWGFFKTSASVLNPLAGDHPYLMSPQGFYHNFANTVTEAEAFEAYTTYAVPESRNVLRDSMGKAGHVDLARPHPPLLFLGGDRDHIIPDKLNRRNAEAYTDGDSISDFQDFAGRGHFICNEPGWQSVASLVEGWLAANVLGDAPIGFRLR
jgi:pimeloyl-ACP methyl ester carboxylesterase